MILFYPFGVRFINTMHEFMNSDQKDKKSIFIQVILNRRILVDIVVFHINKKDDAKSYFPLSVSFLNKTVFGLI